MALIKFPYMDSPRGTCKISDVKKFHELKNVKNKKRFSALSFIAMELGIST